MGLFLPQLRYTHLGPTDTEMSFQILHKLFDQFLMFCVREREIVSRVDNSTRHFVACTRERKAVLCYTGQVVQAAAKEPNGVISPEKAPSQLCNWQNGSGGKNRHAHSELILTPSKEAES